ncbi:MAG: hypothetical protein M3R45_07175 [Pseudomonadota bacterium]|nr:hypothetical protein [Pseudomonadota bacterium]
MPRYLQVRPGAVLAWLSMKPASLERRLFEHLLGAPQAVALNVPALAAALRQPARAIARALFALNRQAGIAVQEAAAPPCGAANPASGAACRGLAGLEQDLRDISCGNGQMMLACEDGFCIAQAGLSPAQAQSLAAQLALGDGPAASHCRAALSFGDRTLHFYASAGIDLKHPLMLRLGARLLQGCQLPSVTGGQ